MSQVRNKRNVPVPIVDYLERWSGSRLTKLRLLLPSREHPEVGWYRWRLEGIHDVSYTNNTGNKVSTFFSALRLPLQEYYKETLLRVAREIGGNDLILDFVDGDSLFSKGDLKDFQVWESLPPWEYRAKEAGLIRIPYIQIVPHIRKPVGRPKK